MACVLTVPDGVLGDALGLATYFITPCLFHLCSNFGESYVAVFWFLAAAMHAFEGMLVAGECLCCIRIRMHRNV